MPGKVTYTIDGMAFSTLEQFYDEIERALVPGAHWGHNLDAFDDLLRGGFGTPDDGFMLRWVNSEVSRARLGYPETVRQLRLKLDRCHASNREAARQALSKAQDGEGPTVFDWLVQIIRRHGDGGAEASSQVELRLE